MAIFNVCSAVLSFSHSLSIWAANGKFCAIFQWSSPIKLIWKFIVVVLLKKSCVRGMCLRWCVLFFVHAYVKTRWKCRVHSNLRKFFFIAIKIYTNLRHLNVEKRKALAQNGVYRYGELQGIKGGKQKAFPSFEYPLKIFHSLKFNKCKFSRKIAVDEIYGRMAGRRNSGIKAAFCCDGDNNELFVRWLGTR